MSTTSMTMSLGGMVQRGLGARDDGRIHGGDVVWHCGGIDDKNLRFDLHPGDGLVKDDGGDF